MTHIRRKFYEIISNLSSEVLKQSHALEGFNYCEQLYKIEKELREQNLVQYFILLLRRLKIMA